MQQGGVEITVGAPGQHGVQFAATGIAPGMASSRAAACGAEQKPHGIATNSSAATQISETSERQIEL